jgi:outer membrane PBP1 activator LpoA protein
MAFANNEEEPQSFAWFWQKKDNAKPKEDASNEKTPPADLAAPVAQAIDTPHIALLLPLTGQFSVAATAVREGFISAYYADSGNNTQTDIRVYDTAADKNVVEAYSKALAEGANIVVGPLTKPGMETLLDSKKVDNKIIVISLNTLEDRTRLPRYLYPFSLGPEDEAFRLAEQAWQDGHKHAGALIEKTPFGRRAAASFKKRFEQLGGQVESMVYFDQSQTLEDPVQYLLKVEEENISLPRFDFLFLMASPQQGRQVPPLLQFYGQHLPIYAMANIYTGTPNPGRDNDLNGIVFCDSPWIVSSLNRSSTLSAMSVQLLSDPAAQERLFAFGVDAYRVAKNIRPLSANPQFTIKGATGTLSMDTSGFIVRQPECARFNLGEPRAL